MTMRNYILNSNDFNDVNGDIYADLMDADCTRAFAGCVDNINVWCEVLADRVRVHVSAMPSFDVFVIIEQGAN
jgi:hypothetical protein